MEDQNTNTNSAFPQANSAPPPAPAQAPVVPNVTPTPSNFSPAPNPNDIITSMSPIISETGKKGGAGFKTFVVLGLIVIALIYGGVAYLFLQNKNTKAGPKVEQKQSGSPTVTPTPEFKPEQVKVLNGNIVWEIPTGETKVLVNKENYVATGITGFARIQVSPDNAKMCFESWAPAPEPALYWSKIDGSQVIEVNPNRQNCIWTSDNMFLMYTNTTPIDGAVNIYKFDTVGGSEENLTASASAAKAKRNYSIVGFSADTTKLICSYTEPASKDKTKTSQCEIDLATGEVKLL